MASLKGKRVAILVAEGVEDLEYYVPLMRLREEGAVVLSAAMDLKPVRGKGGLEVRPDALIGKLSADSLDGVVLAGGWAPDKLRRERAVVDLVRAVDAAGKTVGVICHGGLIAISASIVRGRRATGSLGIKDDLENAGAIWEDKPVVVDRNQISSRRPSDLPDFCRAILEYAG